MIVCGHPPALEVAPGSATTIATGGMVPRGADAVVMVEHTELVDEAGEPAIDLRRGRGQFLSYAGSDIARGEVVLRRNTRISSREIGMLAACGLAEIESCAGPRWSFRPAMSSGARRRACAGAGLRQQRRDHRRRGGGSGRRARAVRRLCR